MNEHSSHKTLSFRDGCVHLFMLCYFLLIMFLTHGFTIHLSLASDT